MKKELFVIDINYYKEITSISLPFLKRYAEKIGAKFTLITDQKFPEMHPSYEKMQIYDLGRDNDWNICIDADFLLREEMYDVVGLIPENFVGAWEQFSADNLYNNRGIDVGIASNFLVVPRRFIGIFKPLEKDEDYRKYCDRPAYVNEYCISLNRQRLGCKLAGIELCGARDNLFKHLNIHTGEVGLRKAVQEAKEFLYGGRNGEMAPFFYTQTT